MIACGPTHDAASPDAVIAKVRACAHRLETERVDLRHAAGRILRRSVHAPEDQPPFDRSAMDGYAVRMDDESETFRVVGRIRAGDWKPSQLRRGEAVQIATGGALPSEGLQVVMREACIVEGEQLKVLQRDSSRCIRFRGEDAKAGQVIVQAGVRLAPGALALLASLGETRPTVTCLPRVVHLVTGDEIVPPGRTPGPGQIRDSNSALVAAFLVQWGIEPRQCCVGERLDDVRARLERQKVDLAQADLLLISGGASVGPHDITATLLEELGYTLHIRRTTTRPGKPMIFATREPALAFGLPGNPLAHFVCLHLYVRQALEGFSGLAERAGFLAGRLAIDFSSQPNPRETLWPAKLRVSEAGPLLTPLPWRSSGDLTSLATANALARIRPDTSTLQAGAPLEFIATSPDL